MTDILASLMNTHHKEAHHLTEAAISVAALASIYSPAAAKAAGEYLKQQAFHSGNEHEREVLTAMADYYLANSRMDASGNVQNGEA